MAKLMTVTTVVSTNKFSWRVNGDVGRPHVRTRLMNHLSKAKLRTLTAMFIPGTTPVDMWIFRITNPKTIERTTETITARGVTCSHNPGSGCFSNARSTDAANNGSPIVASIASHQLRTAPIPGLQRVSEFDGISKVSWWKKGSCFWVASSVGAMHAVANGERCGGSVAWVEQK